MSHQRGHTDIAARVTKAPVASQKRRRRRRAQSSSRRRSGASPTASRRGRSELKIKIKEV